MSEIVFQPIGRRIEVQAGDTLLEAAQQAGVALSAVCGGVGVCGDCRVRVLSGAVSPINETEIDQLSDQHSGLRLACQTIIEGEQIVVDVPPDSLSAVQRSQVEGKELPLALEPSIQVHDLIGRPPSIEDLRGDWERLVEAPDSGSAPCWLICRQAAPAGLANAHDHARRMW
jgi:uncharacterized 2Fe-2S/4Fe-4S cluster protein (DUF4445 family)